jgi:UDP-N-acetylmuramoyl-L-alanyl-D-glutamate--2,6-diaminopimelate ligase
MASRLLGDPSAGLWVVGVTGTNGKTSVSQWIAAALSSAGRTAGVIGTLGATLAGEAGSAINTTPEACRLQDDIAHLRDRGARALAMEVSSIGLDQGRTLGVAFDCAVFTNLTRDHLDYHGDMTRYAQAKARLMAVPSITHAVCNLDDPFGVRLLAALAGSAVTRIGYSMADRPPVSLAHRVLRAVDVHVAPTGTTFQITDGLERYRVFTTLVGQFNLSNLLAVAGALLASGLSLGDVPRLLERLAPVPGRMQRIGGEQAPLVLVDYAHTPDALARALEAASELARVRGGKRVVVFGCGGDRDPGKRVQMGLVAGQGADLVILTSDNPRSESPQAIISEIAAGIAPGFTALQTIIDRGAAIRAAIARAAVADVVLVAGKGHETYQETAGERKPFSDIDVVTQALGAWQPC